MPARQGAPEPIAALNRVKILETAAEWQAREPLVDIRAFCPAVSPVENICPYLRRTVAEMLNRAQAALPEGCRLRVGTALRTLAMQRHGWDGYYQRKREEHPEWSEATLRRAVNRYYAPYDQPAPPGHCTGGAVDVGLLAPDGTELDMIAPTEGWAAVDTWSDKISPEAKANRMLMVEAMLGAGFSNCRDEYWHYSWGDSAWAVRVGESECPYGWIHPPVVLEAAAKTKAPGENAGAFLSGSVEMQRDRVGRVVCAEAGAEISDGADWELTLCWANGIPVTLRLHGIKPQSPLVMSQDREMWVPLPDAVFTGDSAVVTCTPQSDRVYFANSPPSQAAPVSP